MTSPSATPTPDQIRQVAAAAGLNGITAARRLGVSARTYRYWLQGSASIPRAAWEILLALAGLHPDFSAKSGSGKNRQK